ncbi:MAG: N-6 DNA methylase [Candidatus Methanomethylicaceae archaeon]
MSSDLELIASKQASLVAKQLLQTALRGGTEADFRPEAARILEEAGAAAGLTIIPRDEFSVARGRVDSVYNRLILEYKKPGILRDSNRTSANRKVIQQVKRYILDVAKRERREAHRLAGVATDGFFFLFVRRVGEGWVEDDPVPVNPASTERFLRLLFSLSTGAALVPENLLEDFGPKTWRARTAVRAIYRGLVGSKHPLVEKLFEQWRLFFSEVTDYKEWAQKIESKPEFRSFVGALWSKEDIKHLDPAKVFFVIHTYYALLIKLVASLAAARFAGGETAPLSRLAAKKGEELKNAFADLEKGGLFKEYGIRNFLEGDFFGWYLAAWNEDIEEAVSTLVQRLGEYDPGTLELAPENARDLLKKLYHYLLPREIRHDLGEYYTPDWLAERLIRQTLGTSDLGDARKRVLDPACGSGTFLVILIKFIRERAARKGQDPAETLKLILQNVVGIDLNPLAVIAARTNYLFALGDLLKHQPAEGIDIPVYQADSILTPSRGTDLFEGQVYLLKTSAGVFRIPEVMASRERMDALANVLDDAVEAKISEATFLTRVAQNAGLEPEELKAASDDLKALYEKIRELHEQGLNGVWARIIKNAFAPLFLEPCHYIVGNPPWVNWQHLPDDYRLQTKPLWQHYGLFPHGGMDTILGKGKKDISMLMTYVAADRYLRRGGKLGFVLSQSLFKTAGAGQGFRRFLLPDKTPIGPVIVEDMLEIDPFEGASNRTTVAVFTKGQAVKYPVIYQYWKKRLIGRGSKIGFDTPYKDVTSEKITFKDWRAQPVDNSDLTSAWITAPLKLSKAVKNITGKSQYKAYAGSCTWLNSLFWVEITGNRPGGLSVITNITEGAKRKVENIVASVENKLLYPLIRGRDVNKWLASPSCHIIMTQDPIKRSGIKKETMESKYPKAYSYLARFEKILRSRSGYKRYFTEDDPYWSIFNVGEYTFAPWKTIWRGEVATSLVAAVVGKDQNEKIIVPDQTVYFVPFDSKEEAHYLCAIINSSPVRALYQMFSYKHVSMDFIRGISIPKFSHGKKIHLKLSELSEDAHKAKFLNDTNKLKNIEREIDQLTSELWGLSESELSEIQRSFK